MVDLDLAPADQLENKSQVLKLLRQCLRICNSKEDFLKDFNERICDLMHGAEKKAFKVAQEDFDTKIQGIVKEHTERESMNMKVIESLKTSVRETYKQMESLRENTPKVAILSSKKPVGNQSMRPSTSVSRITANQDHLVSLKANKPLKLAREPELLHRA